MILLKLFDRCFMNRYFHKVQKFKGSRKNKFTF